MDSSEDYSFCGNGWESSSKKSSTPRSNGCNSDIGDMCFIMLEYIKDAMKVSPYELFIINLSPLFNLCDPLK